MAKALGTEIVDFYLNGWPEGYCSDESVYSVMDDGRIVAERAPEDAPGLPATDKYELSDFGCIIAEKGDETRDFSYFFNKWKKAKNTSTIIIEVPKEYEEAARMLLKEVTVMPLKVVG